MNQIGRYPVTGVIGSGGFGTVHLGTDPVTGERVAIKVLDWPDEDWRRALFRSEAAALLAIDHPNVVRVREVIDQPGLAALVTDFVEGASLRQVVATAGPLDGPQSLTVLRGALLGLAAVHEAGLVHADLKPDNILLDSRGVSRLIDFGLTGPPRALDGPDTWIGTPSYLAPEVVLGRHIDRRSDLYASAAVLFELLAGRPPYVGPDPVTTALMQVRSPVPDLRDLRADIGELLAALCAQDLAKDPGQRHQNATAFLTSLGLAASRTYGGSTVEPSLAALVSTTVAALAALPGASGLVGGTGLAGAAGLLGSAPLAGPMTALGAGGALATGAGAAGAGAVGAGAAAGTGSAAGASLAGVGGAGAAGAGAAGAGGSAAAGSGGVIAAVGGTKAAIAAAVAVATVSVGAASIVVLDGDEPGQASPPAAAPVEMVDRVAFFRCTTDDDCGLYTIGPDGSGEFLVADVQGDAASAVWSPDGSAIAYTVWDDADRSTGNPSIAVAAADGSGTRTVTTGNDPAWSPDGSRILFNRCSNGCADRQLVVVDAEGGKETVVDTERGGPASWSPDGSRIAYAAIHEGYGGCGGFIGEPNYVIDADGGGRAEVAPSGSIDVAPSWLDDDRLAVGVPSQTEIDEQCGDVPEGGVDVISTDSDSRQQVVALGYSPVASPDGSELAFIRWADSSASVHVTKADGSAGREFDVAFGSWGDLAWSPDGTLLTFSSSDRDDQNGIAVLDPANPSSLSHIHGFGAAWGRVRVDSPAAGPAARGPITPEQAGSLIIPAGACGDGNGNGWNQTDPITLTTRPRRSAARA